MSSFELNLNVDEDVAAASTLDERIHFDEGAHQRVVDAVFPRSWQLLPVPEPAHRIIPFTLLEGALDEPLQLVRDGESERVLSNVCTHRGALLQGGATDAAALVCPYHGRRFDLSGKMASCPGFEDAKGFPREQDNLAELPLRAVGPLRFTSLDPSTDFGEWSAPLERTLAEYSDAPLVYDASGTVDYEFDASWALYCENYLEGFHIPFVHQRLAKEIDFSSYRTDLMPFAARQVAIGKKGGGGLHSWLPEHVVADYLWLYPNLMVNAYPWGISVNLVEPRGVGRCRVRYSRWVARPDLTGAGAGTGLGAVEAEDQEVVLSAQRGVRSRLYPGGRFAPRLETGPHHFQRLMQADLR